MDDYRKGVKEVMEEVARVLAEFSAALGKEDGPKTLFGKTKKDAQKICDDEGKFKCQGVYNQNVCHFHHVINPYKTRQGRLHFQIWELDHR